MAQKPQVIDITRSYFPGDPNAFPENLISTQREDLEEKEPLVVIYEGYNFIPTTYGYRSYFGDNSKLDISSLPSRCDELFIYQLGNLKNIIIALCEDGIWYTSSTTLLGALWTHGITLTIPAVGIYKEWTYTVIENILYMYRQGEPHYWKVTPTGFTIVPDPLGITLTITAVVPTFLNMAGQLGIFRANASLGFWDSANSIGWSSPLNLQDFTPSLTTLAGNAIFSGILGSIVTVKSQGDGFIIYTTKGIVGVRYVPSTTNIWEATTITDTAGISSSKEVTNGMTENEHFAYTSTGIKKLGSYNALNKMHAFENILPEIYDILRENNEFIYLKFMNGRFLFFSLTNTDYINGKVTFITTTTASHYLEVNIGGVPYDPLVDPDPDNINGITFDEAISENIANGWTVGMITQWKGSGVGSYSKIVSPMHSFRMDAKGNHIPNKNHTKALFSSKGMTADNAPISSFVSQSTPNYPKDFAALKKAQYNSLSLAPMGVVSGGLGDYIGAQLAEWINFSTIQAANKAQITAIPPGAISTTLGNTPYPDWGDEMARQITAFAASHEGSTLSNLSITYLETDAGSFLSGNGVIGDTIISGAGTNYASLSKTKTFSGGWKVKRWITRTYSSTRSGPTQLYYWNRLYNGGYNSIDGKIPASVYDRVYYDTIRANIFIKLKAAAIAAGVPKFKNQLNEWMYLVGYEANTYYGTPSPNYDSINYTSPPAGAIHLSVIYWYTADLYSNTYSTQYIDYTEHKFITVEADPSITGSSTLTATQGNVTWGTTTIDSPTNNYQTGAIIPNNGYPDPLTNDINFNVTYPGSTYLLQDGSPAPIYPTYEGALILDTALKKWGKMKCQYKALLDYNSFNSANQNLTPYSNFGVDMAVLKEDGFIYNMDSKPLDSYIKYGKIGYYRLGCTVMHEVNAHFRLPFTGDITVESSLNGIGVEITPSATNFYTNAIKAHLPVGVGAKWHTIKITGNYDLQYLETRGTISGRR